MDYQTLSYAVDEGVATITLNRPESLKSMSPAMAKELNEAALRVEGDTARRAVVHTGNGNAFCAGGDLGE
ncbi:MAG: enoyl-CoA hydratase-related protein, partial [Pseudomonadota bacterium]|nr:enoyl-CoA hydratase-related protein [Pseudomonadota bacterium]